MQVCCVLMDGIDRNGNWKLDWVRHRKWESALLQNTGVPPGGVLRAARRRWVQKPPGGLIPTARRLIRGGRLFLFGLNRLAAMNSCQATRQCSRSF
ncbi:hypothetical protein DEO72_LG3g1667 [Vigna unguiculata]|uniref:Uncharacterized protein n=1 Tax=Vigna unguiculata TaxID=3917 RepID=A0A4D6LG29_VIGUN|nr:hypothetical protein DEO72_LG3g1667 [Vigna unguiculata]